MLDVAGPTTPQPVEPGRAAIPEGTGERRAALRLAMVGVFAALTAGALYLIAVGTRAGQLVGELILGGRPASPETVAAAEQVLSTVSRSSLVLGTLTVVAIALIQHRPRLAATAVVVVVGANLSTQLLKLLLLDRSDLLDGLFYPLPNSFPSGHATAVASIAAAALLVLPPLLRAPSVILSGVVVAIVGISTLVAGWHRMADAIGGVFVATAWAGGSASILAWRRGVEGVGRRTATLGRWSSTAPMLAGAGILALAGLAYVVAAIDPLEVLLFLATRGGSPALFAVGVLITIGTSMLALGALGFALRDIRLDPPHHRLKPTARDDRSVDSRSA